MKFSAGTLTARVEIDSYRIERRMYATVYPLEY